LGVRAFIGCTLPPQAASTAMMLAAPGTVLIVRPIARPTIRILPGEAYDPRPPGAYAIADS
jgi:hypothetical protein